MARMIQSPLCRGTEGFERFRTPMPRGVGTPTAGVEACASERNLTRNNDVETIDCSICPGFDGVGQLPSWGGAHTGWSHGKGCVLRQACRMCEDCWAILPLIAQQDGAARNHARPVHGLVRRVETAILVLRID